MSQPIDPDKTRITAPLARALVLSGALVSGGVYAGMRLQALTSQVGLLQASLSGLPTKEDMRELRRELTDGVRTRLEKIRVFCPHQAPKTDAWMDCRAVFEP